MDSFYKRNRSVINKILLIATVLISIYIIVIYLLPFFAPFFIAIILALINEPLIDFLERKAGFPRKLASLISLLFSISILGSIIALIIFKIYNELTSLQGNLSYYVNLISGQLSEYAAEINSYFKGLPEELSLIINEGVKNLAPKIQGIIATSISHLIGSLTSIPKLTIFIVVTILSTFFISSERRQIRQFIYRQLPENLSEKFSGIKTDTFAAFLGYFRAILTLACFTFVEVSIGLYLIKAEYILLMATVVAISEIIPVFGTGLVMIPWITWNFLSGNFTMAFGLTIIWIIGVIIRQLLEPKIVGSNIGLHPLATLISIYAGLSLFGFLGMFIGPLSIIALKNIQASGLVRFWNDSQ